MRQAFAQSVWKFRNGMPISIASFFEWSDAVDFISHPEKYGAEPGNYYMGTKLTLPEYQRLVEANRV